MPNKSGSLIGVLCRYSTSGLSMSSADAARPPSTEPVARWISRAMAQHASIIDATEMATPDKPVR